MRGFLKAHPPIRSDQPDTLDIIFRMRTKQHQPAGNLFPAEELPPDENLAPGATLLRSFATPNETPILEALQQIEAQSPFRHMQTPGGFRMTVSMTNCGPQGWITDRKGYRYEAFDPDTKLPWPPMPQVFSTLASKAASEAGFEDFQPDACLINRYEPHAKMSLHQDKDEADLTQPIVSVSLGIPAVFLFGGEQRTDKTQRVNLFHGDVVVWGGPARLRYHGVLPLKESNHPLTGPYRINLTFRKAS